jgi:hypothetical protein
MTIQTRLKKLEGKLGVKEQHPAVFIIQRERDKATIQHFLEPVEEGLGHRNAYAEAKRTGLPFIAVDPDPIAEYELRHKSKPGTLGDHELRGKVPRSPR